jgi:plastocyanin
LYPAAVTQISVHSRNHRRRFLALAAAGLTLASLGLTGCWNGKNAATNVQATQPSGNGSVLKIGQMVVDNATAVQDEAGNATVLMRITNEGMDPDTLVAAVLGDQPAVITSGSVEVAPGESVSFAWDAIHFVNVTGLNAPMSSYVPFGLQFANAGITETEILVVPPTGIYENIKP